MRAGPPSDSLPPPPQGAVRPDQGQRVDRGFSALLHAHDPVATAPSKAIVPDGRKPPIPTNSDIPAGTDPSAASSGKNALNAPKSAELDDKKGVKADKATNAMPDATAPAEAQDPLALSTQAVAIGTDAAEPDASGPDASAPDASEPDATPGVPGKAPAKAPQQSTGQPTSASSKAAPPTAPAPSAQDPVETLPVAQAQTRAQARAQVQVFTLAANAAASPAASPAGAAAESSPASAPDSAVGSATDKHKGPPASSASAVAAQAAWWIAAVGSLTPPDNSAVASTTGADDSLTSARGKGGLAPITSELGSGDPRTTPVDDALAQGTVATDTPGDTATVAIPVSTTVSADAVAVAALVRTTTFPAESASVERSIAVPLSDPSWQGAVAAQIQWMASSHVQSATLKLTPEHLGPVEVRIDLQSSQINVSFVALHAETRSALEQSVPMLRAMLASGGLTLGQTHVQSETRQESHSGASLAGTNATPETAEVERPAVAVRSGIGLVDEYA